MKPKLLFAALAAMTFTACDMERVDSTPPPKQDAPMPKAGSTATPDSARSHVRVHYHRFDGNYDALTLWTWDAAHERAPEKSEIEPSGTTSFGVYFEFDPALYGTNGQTRVGLLPRYHRDWSRKDGPDRFWHRDLGREVWIVGTQPGIHDAPPDLSPRVIAAYADSPTRLAVSTNVPISNAELRLDAIEVTDDAGQRIPVVEANLVTMHPGEHRALHFDLTTAAPLALPARSYRVALRGLGGSADLVPRGLLDDVALFGDLEARLGATHSRESTTFRLFAPTASAVDLVLYDEASGPKGRVATPMRRNPKGIFELVAPGDLAGKFYVYRLEGPGLNPAHETLDPYATNAVLSSSRGRITDLAATNPEGWDRLKAGPRIASPVDAVIYEMHVRDFTRAPSSGARRPGTYLGFTEANTRLPSDPHVRTGLDHLVELGVTHVQLLPVQDFANDETKDRYNWGYITSAFNSPEGLYASNPADESRIRELKALVAALHARGIGVILDVVYNHTADSAPFDQVIPGFYFRRLADGSYSNGSGCGNEVRTESPMVRKYVIDSLKYWVEEFGVDGYRFDLMALLDRETMVAAEKELRRIKPDILLYGEPWMAAATTLRHPTDKHALHGTGIGAFNDGFRNALKGFPDGDGPGWIQDGSHRDGVLQGLRGTWFDWADSPEQSVNYMTCHDNLVLIDKLRLSMRHADEAARLQTMKLGYLALFTAQGIPFFHGGEEFARTKGGDHNSYESPDSVNQVDWELKKKHADLNAYVRDLIALRKAHPIFRLRSKTEVDRRLAIAESGNGRVILFALEGAGIPGENWKHVCVALNSGDTHAEVPLPGGPWRVGFGERGTEANSPPLAGPLNLAPRTGVILFQR